MKQIKQVFKPSKKRVGLAKARRAKNKVSKKKDLLARKAKQRSCTYCGSKCRCGKKGDFKKVLWAIPVGGALAAWLVTRKKHRD